MKVARPSDALMGWCDLSPINASIRAKELHYCVPQWECREITVSLQIAGNSA